MRIILAPMEGVINATMRTLLSEVGGVERCVTEFVRVTDTLYPKRVFHRYCPELATGGRTPTGAPVYIQLLGGQPGPMADNAARAAALGAPGIDINFGCPAKLVNRHDGGSILLREPERVYRITAAVREAVPAAIPVTVKIRLGFENSDLLEAVCRAIFRAGADELAIHARTKLDGYRPPAYWEHIAGIKAISPIPVYANGEIWTPADYRRCAEQSRCPDVMLGRGMLTRPDLAQRIRQSANGESESPMPWPAILALLTKQLELNRQSYAAKHLANPVKQWLGYLQRSYPEATTLLTTIKRIKDAAVIRELLDKQLRDQGHPSIEAA